MFDEESAKLQAVMDSLEHNVKSLLKDYGNKKKVIPWAYWKGLTGRGFGRMRRRVVHSFG